MNKNIQTRLNHSLHILPLKKIKLFAKFLRKTFLDGWFLQDVFINKDSFYRLFRFYDF